MNNQTRNYKTQQVNEGYDDTRPRYCQDLFDEFDSIESSGAFSYGNILEGENYNPGLEVVRVKCC